VRRAAAARALRLASAGADPDGAPFDDEGLPAGGLHRTVEPWHNERELGRRRKHHPGPPRGELAVEGDERGFYASAGTSGQGRYQER